MYRTKNIGKNKYVSIAQTYSGWSVSTYSINGRRIKKYDSRNFRRLADAKKDFTRQVRKYSK